MIRFHACREQGLGWFCDAQGWLIRRRISRISGKWENFVEGRCSCWLRHYGRTR